MVRYRHHNIPDSVSCRRIDDRLYQVDLRAGWFDIGVVLAGRYYVALADHLGFISNENAARVLAFIIILAAVGIVAGLARNYFHQDSLDPHIRLAKPRVGSSFRTIRRINLDRGSPNYSG